MEIEKMQTPLLVAFGIPTVDFSFLVSDKEEVDRYGLNIDSQLEMSYELLNSIKTDFYRKKYGYKKLAGGNCQVSLMVFQSLLSDPYQTIMFGAVGDDEEGLFLEKFMRKVHVETQFDTIENERTANCVILVHKDLRTIAVMNGAGSDYSLGKCTNLKTKLDLVKMSKVVLFEGFFIAFSFDLAMNVIRQCKKNGNIVAVNISGVYVVTNYQQKLIECLSLCDILIGNSSEFEVLCNVLNIKDTDCNLQRSKLVQKKMLNNMNEVKSKLKSMEKWKKIVVVTDNKNPIYCAYGDDESVEYKVPSIKNCDIKDTTGGGDSFLAGFLYSLVKEESIVKCLETGCLVASKVIQQHGYDIKDSISSILR